MRQPRPSVTAADNPLSGEQPTGGRRLANPPGSFTPAGSVSAQFEGERAVVWLTGGIDVALAGDLDKVSDAVLVRATQVMLETAHMSFCDAVLAQFLREVSYQVPVTIRQPTPAFRQFLASWGLIDRVNFSEVSDEVPKPEGELETAPGSHAVTQISTSTGSRS